MHCATHEMNIICMHIFLSWDASSEVVMMKMKITHTRTHHITIASHRITVIVHSTDYRFAFCQLTFLFPFFYHISTLTLNVIKYNNGVKYISALFVSLFLRSIHFIDFYTHFKNNPKYFMLVIYI